MLTRAATVLQQLCKSCRTCFIVCFIACFILVVIAPSERGDEIGDEVATNRRRAARAVRTTSCVIIDVMRHTRECRQCSLRSRRVTAAAECCCRVQFSCRVTLHFAQLDGRHQRCERKSEMPSQYVSVRSLLK